MAWTFPTPDEVRAFLDALEGAWRPFFLVAVFAGLRSSELRGLRWQDVDLKRNAIHVRQRVDEFGEVGPPKSEAGSRTIPIPPLVSTTLKKHRLGQKPGAGFVFANPAGEARTHTNAVNKGLVPAMKRAGVVTADGAPRYTGLHALRHFYASWCINQREDGGLGLPIKTVQQRMGHASIVMTADVYGHLFPRTDNGAELDAAAGALANRRDMDATRGGKV